MFNSLLNSYPYYQFNPYRLDSAILQFVTEHCKMLSLYLIFQSLDPSRRYDLMEQPDLVFNSILEFFSAYGVIFFSLSRIAIPINVLQFVDSVGLANRSGVNDALFLLLRDDAVDGASSCVSWWDRTSFLFQLLAFLPPIQPSFLAVRLVLVLVVLLLMLFLRS